MARGSRKRPGSPPPERAAPRKTEVVVYVPPDRGPVDWRGRHTIYSEEIVTELLARLAEGELLSSICFDDHMPSTMTVKRWKRGESGAPADFATRFEDAKENGIDMFVESAAYDAEHPLIGETRTVKIVAGQAQEVTIKRDDNVGRARLKTETKLKLAAMWSARYRQAAVPAAPPDPESEPRLRVTGGLPEGEP